MSHTDKTRPWAVRAEDSLEVRRAHHDHLRFGKAVYKTVDLYDAAGEPVTWRNVLTYRDENGDGAGKWRVEWHGGNITWHALDDRDWFHIYRSQVKDWQFALAPAYTPPFWGYPTRHEGNYRTYAPETSHGFDRPLRVRILKGYMLDYCTCRYPAPAGTPDEFIPCGWYLGHRWRYSSSRYRDPKRLDSRLTLSEATKRYNSALVGEVDGLDEEGLWEQWEDGYETPTLQHAGWWD